MRTRPVKNKVSQCGDILHYVYLGIGLYMSELILYLHMHDICSVHSDSPSTFVPVIMCSSCSVVLIFTFDLFKAFVYTWSSVCDTMDKSDVYILHRSIGAQP